MDCASWLVETERPLARFTVQSANPGRAGRDLTHPPAEI
jgi:hypothetical protein